jgi:ribonucleoside-diphosphate reductase alpha chain
VSATISLKADEWSKAGKWMWDNRECYNGLSVLPYDGGTYTQAPFEDITEKEFNKRVKLLNDVDLSMIVEETDETDLSGELACAGGVCEITSL